MKKLIRTMLFAPASNPKMLINAPVYEPDCILFDLEDAVPYAEKDSARDLLCEALKSINYGNCKIFARINPLRTPEGSKAPFGEKDVSTLVPSGLKNIRLPMCETPEHIIELSALLDKIEAQNGIPSGTVKIQASLETPLGIHNAKLIAETSDRVISISFGAEDYTRTLGVDRTKVGNELFYARAKVVMAAALAKVDAIDTVWADVSDKEGFQNEVEQIKGMGFAGKSCIHPSQIKIVHSIFTPKDKDIERSIEIINAAKKADILAGGVITVNGKMIDIPVIEKAKKIINLAKAAGKLKDGKIKK